MKFFSFVILSSFILSGVSSQSIQDNKAEPTVFSITFEEAHKDFGKVKKGEIITTDYEFENTGTEIIKIELVSGCECTTLDWPRKAIHPGEKGKVNVIFDSGKKEESETVDIDVNFENIDPESGYNRFEILTYKFELIE